MSAAQHRRRFVVEQDDLGIWIAEGAGALATDVGPSAALERLIDMLDGSPDRPSYGWQAVEHALGKLLGDLTAAGVPLPDGPLGLIGQRVRAGIAWLIENRLSHEESDGVLRAVEIAAFEGALSEGEERLFKSAIARATDPRPRAAPAQPAEPTSWLIIRTCNEGLSGKVEGRDEEITARGIPDRIAADLACDAINERCSGDDAPWVWKVEPESYELRVFPQ